MAFYHKQVSGELETLRGCELVNPVTGAWSGEFGLPLLRAYREDDLQLVQVHRATIAEQMRRGLRDALLEPTKGVATAATSQDGDSEEAPMLADAAEIDSFVESYLHLLHLRLSAVVPRFAGSAPAELVPAEPIGREVEKVQFRVPSASVQKRAKAALAKDAVQRAAAGYAHGVVPLSYIDLVAVVLVGTLVVLLW